jgi:NAD(P)-dependent dehydrogenase (short-subunit alcohol dehydrogenase family)
MSRFIGKNVVVTGGTGGVGKAMVTAFLAEGAKVVVLGSAESRLQALLREIGAPRLSTAQLDLREGAETIRRVARAVGAQLGEVHVLVNCAGVAVQTPVLDITEEQWDQTFAVNLKGAFFLSQEFARQMSGGGGGVIVNISSADGFRGNEALYADYCASKAGLSHLTTAMAFELAPLGIRCNAVAPGPVATPMMDFADDESVYEYYVQSIAQRRFSSPEEQAKAVLFLASEDASNITGETLRVDGGWMIGMWPDPKSQPKQYQPSG